MSADPNMPECDDDLAYRENMASDSGDEWTKADLMDYYSRFPEAMDDWCKTFGNKGVSGTSNGR